MNPVCSSQYPNSMNCRRIPIALLLLVGFLSAQTVVKGQCDVGNIGWLSKMLRIKHTFSQPANITFTTKPSSVYEIPFFLVVYASFVKADGKPYFYVWLDHQRYEAPTDINQGDALRFYLTNGSTVSTSSLTNYPGIKGQSLGFYPLTGDDLTALSTTAVDSIAVTTHPKAASKAPTAEVMLRFSERNKRRIMDWSACLKD